MVKIRLRKPLDRMFHTLARGYIAAHPHFETRHK